MKSKLTQKYLKESLEYNPETGIFTWRERPENHFKDGKRFNKEINCKKWNSKLSNKVAGTLNKIGYIAINIYDNIYLAHRLAFLYMEGYFPEYEVDHINRIRNDNRWCNLRHVTPMCNSQNCKILSTNTSGVIGVVFSKRTNKWIARLEVNGKQKNLGSYTNFDDAVKARYNEELNNPLFTCSVESSSFKYLNKNNLI